MGKRGVYAESFRDLFVRYSQKKDELTLKEVKYLLGISHFCEHFQFRIIRQLVEDRILEPTNPNRWTSFIVIEK